MKRFVKAYNEGKTIKEIATEFNVGKTTVWEALKIHDIEMKPRGDRRKFDLEKALKYREKGYSYRMIARILKVSHSGVYRKISRAEEAIREANKNGTTNS